MDLTNIPTLVAVPFASGAGVGYINPVPVASQISITPGAASYIDGFVPVNFQPIASGGIPPFGADFNGILNALSVGNRWNQAGGRYYFDATFSTAITGYPKGATLNRTDNLGAWISTVDNNTTDPNSTSSAGWVPVRANAVAVSIAITAGVNTPTKEKLGSQVIVCTGAIASAATLVLPLTAGSTYIVRNNTTGAGSLTVIGATGSGSTIPQTVGYVVYTDGVNFYGIAADVSGLYLPIGGTAVAATKLAAARNFSLGGAGSVLTSATVSFDGTGNVVIKADMADAALSIAKTNGLQTALDAKAPKASPVFTGTATAGALAFGNGQALIQWNVAGIETGETSFVNHKGTGGGGFAWFNLADGGSIGSPLMALASNGILTVSGLAASGAISGSTVSASGAITAAGGFQVG